jgi:general stress protein YciG
MSGKSTSSQSSELGKKGGQRGGPARSKALTAQQRSDIAKKGGQAKNAKNPPKQK